MIFSCAEVAELSPWLLNGSLEDDHKQLLLEHLEGCQQCRLELQETHRAQVLFDTHPPAQELALLVFGTDALSIDRELLMSHLENCEACQSEIEMIRAEISEPETTEDRRVLVPNSWAPRRTSSREAGIRSFWQVAAVLALVVGSILVGREIGQPPVVTSAPETAQSGRIAGEDFEGGSVTQQMARKNEAQVMVFANGFEAGNVEDWPKDPSEN